MIFKAFFVSLQSRKDEETDMMQVRKSLVGDIDRLLQLMEAAKGIMRNDGNMTQWADGYPQREVIEHDIAQGHSYVCVENDTVVATFVFMPGPEPTYSHIEDGAWIDDVKPYYVIHRVASTPDSHGVFKAMMEHCLQYTDNIRIDTHRDNRIMRHCFERNGFRYCGIIHIRNGEERVAYQRLG